MCDTSDNDDGPQKIPKLQTCRRCKANEASIFFRDSYCSECFQEVTVGRFRRSLMVLEKAPVGKKALLALSGGISSKMLSKLLHEYQPGVPKDKKRFPAYIVCHVDKSALEDEPQEDVSGLQQWAESLGMTFKNVPMEDIFLSVKGEPHSIWKQSSSHKELFELEQLDEKVDTKTRLNMLLSSVKSPTGKASLKQSLLMHSLRRVARMEDCKTIIFGDNSTTIAARIVSKTSEGGGFGLPDNISSESVDSSGLVLYRPFRDTLGAEILKLAELKNVEIPYPQSSISSRKTIQSISVDFVMSLQLDFPQTISTVTRTAFKVAADSESSSGKRCLLCDDAIQVGSLEWRSRHTLSSLASILPATDEVADDFEKMTINSDAKSINLTSSLCYACQNIVFDVEDAQNFILPISIQP